MLAIILWTIGVYLGLCFLDWVFGQRLFPGKTGVVEINKFTDGVKNGRFYCVYKYHRSWLFFNIRRWFTTHENSTYSDIINKKSTSPYHVAQLLNDYYRNISEWKKSKGYCTNIPGDRLDIAIITAKVFANKHKLSEIIEDRSEPVEVWNSRQTKVKEELSEEDTLTLRLGEAIRDNNQVEVANLTQELKEKKYI